MANTYAYKVTQMQRESDGIVITVSFTVTASDGTDSFTHNYHTALPAPKGTAIPFEDLTEAKVIAWIKDLVGKQTEEQADAELAAYKVRKTEVTTPGLPW